MKNQNTQQEEVRCINKKTGKVKFFRRWFAFDKNWQRSTGFTPEELPKVEFANDAASPEFFATNPHHDALENEYTGKIVDNPAPDFDESLITTPSESYSEQPKYEVVNAEPIKETPTTAKPKGKKADKTTHK